MTKIRKFLKWLFGLFNTTTVVTLGKGNSTFVSQTTKVTAVSTEQLLDEARQVNKANGLMLKTAPSQRGVEFKAANLRKHLDERKTATLRSHTRNVQSSRATTPKDDDAMAIVAMSSVYYSSSSSSDDGGSYSSGDCCSSSSSCD